MTDLNDVCYLSCSMCENGNLKCSDICGNVFPLLYMQYSAMNYLYSVNLRFMGFLIHQSLFII